MPRPTRGPRLGAGPAHERAILRQLSRSLIDHGRIVTTETKAKRVRPFVEKLITKARKGGLHRRRLVLSELQDTSIVHKLFDEVAPAQGERPGGYTRILKLGHRRGDATPMAILELVTYVAAEPEQVVDEEKPRRRLRRRRDGEGADEASAELAGDDPEVVADVSDEPDATEEPDAPDEPDTSGEPDTVDEPDATEEPETAAEPVPVGAGEDEEKA